MTFFAASCRNAINFIIAIPLTELITIFENFPLKLIIDKIEIVNGRYFLKTENDANRTNVPFLPLKLTATRNFHF